MRVCLRACLPSRQGRGWGDSKEERMWKIFVDAVARHFHYLETDFGFLFKSSTLPFVIYESGKLTLAVFYDVHGRQELDLGIRKLDSNRRKSYSLSVGILMRLRNGQDTQGYESPFPSNEEALNIEVERLAGLLQEYGAQLLRGDLSDFDRMEEWEREAAKRYGP
jgi:hypothetical protein